jgi:hypothetical protein
MTRKKALEWWETKISNAEVTPQDIWPIAKSLLHPFEKANAIADCLEIQFTPHDPCDDNHEWRVEPKDQALLETIDTSPPRRIRPCDL